MEILTKLMAARSPLNNHRLLKALLCILVDDDDEMDMWIVVIAIVIPVVLIILSIGLYRFIIM